MQQARRPRQPTQDATNDKVSKSSSSNTSDKKKKRSVPQVPSTAAVHKLTKQQVAELLKVFWAELLQNNARQVRKILVTNLHSLDFRTAKYAPAADGSALHLCAQHGLLAMAQLLVDLKVVDLNAQSKVGPTPLHVACKFAQEPMLLFLLELGVRVDIPDSQHRIAFDVAPFAVIDRCILAPLREQQRAAQEENDELRRQDADAIAAVEEAQREHCNAKMALADAESWAFAERELLSATRAIDNEWSGRVQGERDKLERHRAVYREHLDVLEDTRERVESARGQLMAAVEREKTEAQRAMEQAELRIFHVQQALEAEQQDLDDQLGLLDAANALPSDPAVQEWMLSTMQAMVEEDERSPLTGSEMTRSARLLARVEVVAVVSNALSRFSTSRHLQLCALRSLSVLITHVVSIIETCCCSVNEKKFLLSFLDRVAVMKTEKSTLLALCRDTLVRFSADVEMNTLVAAIHHRLLRARPSCNDGAFRAPLLSMRFSHESRNQKLPLDMLRLYEQARRLGSVLWTDSAWAKAVRDAAFLLFTVTKSNATKTLLANNAISTAIFWICELAAMCPGDAATDSTSTEEAKLAAMQYLLGALSFLHSVPWLPTASATVMLNSVGATASSLPMLEKVHPWSATDVQTLLNAVVPSLPSLDEERRSLNSAVDAATRRYCMLVRFWTLKLLRNLALHHGEAARAVRIELFAPQVFVLLSETAFSLLRFNAELSRESRDDNGGSGNDSQCDTRASDVPDRSAIAGVWLDLAEMVWVRHYDVDGKLRSTAKLVMGHVLALLSWQMQHLSGGCCPDVGLAVCSRMLGAVALALSNDKNARWLGKSAAVLDDAARAFLRWLLTLCDLETGELASSDTGVSSTSVFEALAHVLRIYQASLRAQLADDQDGDGVTAAQHLHGRCHAVGLCAVLRAFRKADDSPDDDLRERQEEGGASGHVASMKRMRAASKANAPPLPPPHAGPDEHRVLRALGRAVAQLVGCRC